jgi:hypothetical protein
MKMRTQKFRKEWIPVFTGMTKRGTGMTSPFVIPDLIGNPSPFVIPDLIGNPSSCHCEPAVFCITQAWQSSLSFPRRWESTLPVIPECIYRESTPDVIPECIYRESTPAVIPECIYRESRGYK